MLRERKAVATETLDDLAGRKAEKAQTANRAQSATCCLSEIKSAFCITPVQMRHW